MKNMCDESGMTIVEMLVAMAIGSVIMLGVSLTFTTQKKAYTVQDYLVEMDQTVKVALKRMVEEIRMAGYDPTEALSVGTTVGIVAATASSLQIQMDLNNNGAGDGDTNDSGENVTFSYDAGINKLQRYFCAAADNTCEQTLAENINSATFAYFDGSNNITTNLPNIRIVQITIQAYTSKEHASFANATVKFDINGDGVALAKVTTYTVRVKPRNLGLVKSGI